MDDLRVAVVGAGIGGLTLALALRRHGIACDIYEKTGELGEVGAAVALSANATRFLEGPFGLKDQLDAVWADIPQLVYRDVRSGTVIGRHYGGDSYRKRYGATYAGIHRKDLQSILSGAVGDECIHLGKAVVGCDLGSVEDGRDAVLTFADGTSAAADIVVAADGARSIMRRMLLGYDDALYSGCSAFRGVVDADRIPSMPDPDAIQFWMGPGGHMLHYPSGSGKQNFFLVHRGPAPWPSEAWTVEGTAEDRDALVEDWHPALREMVDAAPVGQRWALMHRPPLARWNYGRVSLLGDSAHALVPHHGQGANQSMEDAVVLADCLADAPDVTTAQDRYFALRHDRTRKVQYASITTADVLHLPDDSPLRAARDARLADPSMPDRHLDWIHGHVASDVDHAPQDVAAS
ncbi:FAD-dependent monooxygenase [Williamsia serinedens]|uniref:Salicylate hydroxylase n=1 Tax=Williamsia serinedens TaxID=391736 RepID=A0ABT1H0W5_9NOCA|nr:FAD-dependent monooxygenase [Williamsia serinedens]MCP2160614.1 salicylate hydroxylase [Williamsia serinedens]